LHVGKPVEQGVLGTCEYSLGNRPAIQFTFTKDGLCTRPGVGGIFFTGLRLWADRHTDSGASETGPEFKPQN
jgi:hypothetical protein